LKARDGKTDLQHVYEVRPRKDKRGFDLISDALPFGRLWYAEPNAISNAIGYAKHRSRSHPAVIRVFDESGTVIETHDTGGRYCALQPHLLLHGTPTVSCDISNAHWNFLPLILTNADNFDGYPAY
jgi:hypothetical protein